MPHGTVEHAPAPPGVMSPRRRPSFFAVLGVVLGALTVATVTASFAVRTVDFSVDAGDWRFADLGLACALIGWAAFAPSYARAALRPLVVTAVFWTFLFLMAWALEAGYGRSVVQDLIGCDEQREFVTRLGLGAEEGGYCGESIIGGSIIAISPGDILGVLLQGLFGIAARAAAVTASALRRRLLTAALLAVFVATSWPFDAEGAASVVASLAALAWLLWALHRAHARHARRRLAD